jgi:polar amino acid transport system substrate-binding protein
VGAYKEDAPDLSYPEEAQAIDDTAFWSRPGKQWTFDQKHLLTTKIAVIGGYHYDGGILDAHIDANQSGGLVHAAKGNDALEKNIKMLLAGRVDIVVESPSVMSAKLKHLGKADQVVEVARMNDPSEIYIACTPGKKRIEGYIKLLTDGTRALRASGELKTILDKYGVSDWK